MKCIAASRNSRRLGKLGLIGLLGSALLITSCVAPLLYNKELPPLKAPEGKALCVILRPMAITGSNTVNVYCDKKWVGATEGNTLLTFPVDAGEHYVIGDATNKSIVKYNFQAGKVYFILHTVVTISSSYFTIVTSTFAPMDGSSATGKIDGEKGKISWVQPNPEYKDAKDLSDKDLADIQKDYAERAKKNPDDFQKEADYPGY
jgi:hypothetical protein